MQNKELYSRLSYGSRVRVQRHPWLLLFLLFGSLSASQTWAAKFQFLPGEFTNGSNLPTLSDDGRTVYGSASDGDEHLLETWSESDGYREFSLPLNFSVADVALEGTVVGSVRWFRNPDGFVGSEPSVWTEANGLLSLDPLQQYDRNGSAKVVSADGSVIAGDSRGTMLLWNNSTEPTELGGPEGYDSSRIIRISDDGDRIYGHSSGGDEGDAVWKWTAQDGFALTLVGSLPSRSPGLVWGKNGVVLFGTHGPTPQEREVYRWTETDGLESLGLADGASRPSVRAISHDGSVIVGRHEYWDENISASFVWDSENGMRDLETVLRREHRVSIPSNSAFVVSDMSNDLETLVGWYDDPLQLGNKSWVIQLDRPLVDICDANSMGDLDGNGKVEFADFLALSANFGQPATNHETGDIDCNGTVEFADFLILSANFGQTIEAVSVPEPTGEALVIFGLLGVLLDHSRTSRSDDETTSSQLVQNS